MGGFNGFTESAYLNTTDRAVVESLFAPRDTKGRLITLAERLEEAREEAEWARECGVIRLPGWRELDVPDEAYHIAQPSGLTPPLSYLRMFWTVWRRRGTLATEEILERWRAVVERGEDSGHADRHGPVELHDQRAAGAEGVRVHR